MKLILGIRERIRPMTATLTTLVNFPYLAGFPPFSLGDLIADSNGDLFGVAPVALNNEGEDDGLVFEIAKTAGGYASTPTTIASFDGKDGTHPLGGLIADANGDLFGTTGGDVATNDRGTVFEIAKTPTGYADTPITLATFNGADGQRPNGASSPTPRAISLAQRSWAVRATTTSARCSRSPRPRPATPTLPPLWSALTRSTARNQWAD
jgi:hypothetical protein